MSDSEDVSSYNTGDSDQDPPVNKKLKPTPTYASIKKCYTNMQYLDLRRNEFWHLAEEKRRKFTPLNEEQTLQKAYNEEYVNVNSFPPFSALRINQRNGHTRQTQPTENCVSKTHVREVPTSTNSSDKESSKSYVKNIITHDTVEATIDKWKDPYKLMCISDLEQDLFKFTIEEKQGLPMYEEIEDKSEEDESQSDDFQRRVFSKDYKPRRIVPPPEYPFAYYRLRRDQECNWCGYKGKNCHNIRYGMFLCSVVTRYHRMHPNDYNEFDAVRIFRDTYVNLFEFEDYLESRKIEGMPDAIIVPECMLFDSLVFALNSVEWSIMWGHNEQSVATTTKETVEEANSLSDLSTVFVRNDDIQSADSVEGENNADEK